MPLGNRQNKIKVYRETQYKSSFFILRLGVAAQNGYSINTCGLRTRLNAVIHWAIHFVWHQTNKSEAFNPVSLCNLTAKQLNIVWNTRGKHHTAPACKSTTSILCCSWKVGRLFGLYALEGSFSRGGGISRAAWRWYFQASACPSVWDGLQGKTPAALCSTNTSLFTSFSIRHTGGEKNSTTIHTDGFGSLTSLKAVSLTVSMVTTSYV